MIDLNNILKPKIFEFHGEYSVYEHIFPDGKKYIGIAKDPEVRWKKGEGYATNKKMYEAIQSVGWDNIQHNIILGKLMVDQAVSLEKYLIKLNDSVKNGYNNSPGGETGENRYSKSVNKVLNACKDYIQMLDISGDVTALISWRDNEKFAIRINYLDQLMQDQFEDYELWYHDDQLMFCVYWLCNIRFGLSGGDLTKSKYFAEVSMKNMEEIIKQQLVEETSKEE